MHRHIFRRTLSVLLAVALLLTTMSASISMIASAKVETETTTNTSDVIFLVPEAIYLKPTWNSYYQAQQMPFQIYVNNTLENGSTVICSTQENTQGVIVFYYPGATSAKISFDWMNEVGATMYEGTVTFGDQIERSRGMAYTAASSATQTIAITAGTSPTMSADQTGAYLKWTATFTDNTDGREKTAVAYTYVYKPYVAPVGSVIRVKNTHGTNSYGSNISWICGVHGITGTEGDYYANTTLSSDGHGLLPISSSVHNGEQVGTDGLYAQLASSEASESRFFHDRDSIAAISEPEPTMWINQTTSPRYLPDKTLNYVDNNTGTSVDWFGDYSFFTLVCSPTATLSVDTSRYVNLSQIPNLSVSMLVTDTRNTKDGGVWFFSNYTGEPGSTYYNNQHSGTSSAEELWNRYSASGVFATSGGSYAEPVSSAQWQGIKYNGRWKKPITTASESGTYYIGTGYFNRDSEDASDHYGNDTIWNVSEIRTSIQFYNKGSLRTAVQNAIRKSAILNSAFYSITSAAWTNYENLYEAAAKALTKLNGTFSATASIDGTTTTYSTPDALASALTTAVNRLLNGTARVYATAVQTNVGLALQSDGKYKCVAIEETTAKERLNFTSYDKVAFSANDYIGFTFLGLSQTNYEQTVQVGANVQLPNSFTTSVRGGTVSDGTVTFAHTDTTGTDGNGNLYFTYYYLVNTYTVHFDPNNGTGTMDDQSFQYGVQQNLSANAFTRRAYAFTGWSTTSNGSVQYGDEAAVLNLVTQNGGSTTLYAIWEPITYTIIYYLQGGSLIGTYTTDYTVETPIGLPDAVKPGYELSGWRANGAGNWGEMSYGCAASIVPGKYGNVAMTAQWRAISYTVTFNGNGATSGSMSNQSFLYEETKNLTANAFQRTGFTFGGWAFSDDATAAIFKDKASVSNLTTTPNDTVTLYAVWNASTYSIIYNTDEGTILDTAYTTQYTITQPVQLPVQLEKPGFGFNGWKPAASVGNWDAQTIYNGQLTAGLYGNITLNAQWGVRDYTILYNTDGGTITSQTYTTEYKASDTVTLPAAQRNGYLLAGWEANGAGNWDTILYTVGTVSSGKYGDVTMTAKWTGVTYLISFNGNGSTGGVMYNQSVEYGLETPLDTNAYARNGYAFLGWSASNAATEPTYADGATILNLCSNQGETFTLYAVWGKLTYTVTYEPLGGTLTSEGTESYTVTELLRLPTVSRKGYTFNGWTPESSVGSWQALVLYSGTINAGQFGDVKLVAQWTKNTYAIRYDAAGGTMSGNYTTEYSVDTTITLPTVTRTGFAFDGWQADAAWNEALIQTATVPAGNVGDVVLRAVWAQRNYTVRFNACGGSGTMEPQIMQFDIEQPLRLNAFTRDGYTFNGWAGEPGGTSVYPNGSTVLNLSTVDNGTVDLYATWLPRSFTIKYNLNGAGGSMLTSSVTMDGDPITLRNCTQLEVTMNSIPYQFSGWAYTLAEAAAGTVAYENKATFTLDSEVLSKATVDWTPSKPVITLYAVWVNIKVTLDGRNGAIIDDENHLIYGVEERVTERLLREKYLSVTGIGSIEIDYVTYVGTGTFIRLVNAQGEDVETYQLVIFGDVDGDGAVTLQDITYIKRIMNGAQEEDEDSLALMAADVDDDGVITLMDLTTTKGIVTGAVEYDQATKTW